MGQYYRIINVDKEEVLYSFDFGNGQKLMEWSYCENPMCLAMLNLMADEWKGDRVYVVGDYADDSEDECWVDAYKAIGRDIYSASDKFTHRVPEDHSICEFRNGFDNTIDVSTEDKGYRYIINRATGEYIDLAHCPLAWVWINPKTDEAFVNRIFPLSLLLAMGNGRGGGDFRGEDSSLCGVWCDDVQSIEVSRDCPEDLEEFNPDFYEDKLVPYTDMDKFIEEERKRQAEWKKLWNN